MTFSNMDYWRLSGELSVVDAAILITGNDPSEFDYSLPGGFGHLSDYDGFDATFKALTRDILSNRIRAKIARPARQVGKEEITSPDFGGFANENEGEIQYKNLIIVSNESAEIATNISLNGKGIIYYLKEPDWGNTTIEVEEIKTWLDMRGIYPDFFFPQGKSDGFRDKRNRRYSPKLACAVAAWEAVKRPSKNKSVKQSIEDWVTSNAASYGMAGDDGIVPKAAIEDVAKVVNWNTKGGATPTSIGNDQDEKSDDRNGIENFENFYKDGPSNLDS